LSISARLFNLLFLKITRCSDCYVEEQRKRHAERTWANFKACEVEFAREHAGEKIRAPATGAVEAVRATVVEAIESEWDAVRLRDELIARFGFPEKRAMLIAGTELGNAFKPASRDLDFTRFVEPELRNAVRKRAYDLYTARPPTLARGGKPRLS
jgi:hypothetical protein